MQSYICLFVKYVRKFQICLKKKILGWDDNPDMKKKYMKETNTTGKNWTINKENKENG